MVHDSNLLVQNVCIVKNVSMVQMVSVVEIISVNDAGSKTVDLKN
jgi:hypothetical protein